VRALIVVFTAKASKPPLLVMPGRRRRPSGFGFQGAVHPFMLGILLGMTVVNSIHQDPQADPPRGQRRQSRDPWTREGGTVVRPDTLGQAVGGKGTPKRGLRRRVCGPQKPVAAQQVPTKQIHDRERIAPPAITRAEFAFVVDGPHHVGAGA
jgi:hypothetical protein